MTFQSLSMPDPIDYKANVAAAGQMVHDLQVTKLESEPITSSGTNDAQKRATASIDRPDTIQQARQIRQPPSLFREQLHGLLPPSYELNDYELRERPMTMCG